MGAGQIANQRCTNDTSIHCINDTPCAGGGGTCEFFTSAPLPMSGGGITLCLARHVDAAAGTYDPTSGALALTSNETMRVYSGPSTTRPCAKCVGDTTANDGVPGGTCNGGARNTLGCDGNGTSPYPDFGTTSLDCPSSAGTLVATIATTIPASTAGSAITLSSGSPNCTEAGFTGLECACDTCATALAQTCSSDADCPGVPCGGRRCISGANNGAVCGAGSACPGGVCARRGELTKPNACSGGVCTPTGGGEGQCASGPMDSHCAAPETYRSCAGPGDCPLSASCVSTPRECFTDNGVSGASISAGGASAVPAGGVSTPTLGAVDCAPPTGSSVANIVLGGLPGPERLSLKVTATELP